MRRGLTRALLAGGAVTVTTLAMTGVAMAVSGGGYQSGQQDCSQSSDAWNYPAGRTQPGCHDVAVNVEGGGTNQGNASPDNTRYAEAGVNQEPHDANSPGTPTPLSLGYPGAAASPHSGCVAANTDGTGGGTGANKGTGCGNNGKGAGGSATFDYYALYCPVAQNLPAKQSSSNPVGQCEDRSYPSSPTGAVNVAPDTGSALALMPILEDGLVIYFGMDDNVDNGEHDGVSGTDGAQPSYNANPPGSEDQQKCGTTGCPAQTAGIVNGPSDGGGVTVSITPLGVSRAPSLTHPEGVANGSVGFCADGICLEFTTQQQTVYHGCEPQNPNKKARNNAAAPYDTGQNYSDDQCPAGTPKGGSSGNVYDYTHPTPSTNPKGGESANCNSGDAYAQSNQNCGGAAGMNQYRQGTPTNMNTEPGVQLYGDPDPQRSPAAPWPTPGVYVGTCGVYANNGAWTDTGQWSQGNLPTVVPNNQQLVAQNTGC